MNLLAARFKFKSTIRLYHFIFISVVIFNTSAVPSPTIVVRSLQIFQKSCTLQLISTPQKFVQFNPLELEPNIASIIIHHLSDFKSAHEISYNEAVPKPGRLLWRKYTTCIATVLYINSVFQISGVGYTQENSI
jgi:hypothetical protein